MNTRPCGIEPVGASLLANRPKFGADPFASKLAPTKSPLTLEALS